MICNQCKYYQRSNGYCSMRDQDFAPHAGCDKGRSKWDDEDECYSDDEDEDGDWDNKCKAFTSLEQSRKLAEILPLESADMYYHPYPNDEDWYDIPNLGEANLKYNQLPCWSLASLLSVLPANKLEKQFDGKWWFSVYLPSGQHKSHKHDNPIDACVEVILNLHKLNLL